MRILEGLAALRLCLGREVGVSDWLEIPQEMIDAFAAVTGDRQWIHIDVEKAQRESPYKTTIAHGFLTLSLLSRLHGQAVEIHGLSRIINYGLNRVRFPAPVPAGARLRTHSTLQALEELPDCLQATWLITVEVEGKAKPALIAEWLVRLYP